MPLKVGGDLLDDFNHTAYFQGHCFPANFPNFPAKLKILQQPWIYNNNSLTICDS